MYIKDKGIRPDPNKVYPMPNEAVSYVKPTIRGANVIVGDFTYFSDKDFMSHIEHHYGFYKDRLIIGKFCQIARGIRFIMNGANHQMNAVTTYPFYILEGWDAMSPNMSDLVNKGDTVVGNDVWIGENVTVLPGVHIGDGAIIGLNSTVAQDVPPYTIVAGDPARTIRKRFDDSLIALLLKFKWWDKSIDEINALIPILTSRDIDTVKREIETRLGVVP